MILVPFFEIPNGNRLAKNVNSQYVQVIPRSTTYSRHKLDKYKGHTEHNLGTYLQNAVKTILFLSHSNVHILFIQLHINKNMFYNLWKLHLSQITEMDKSNSKWITSLKFTVLCNWDETLVNKGNFDPT